MFLDESPFNVYPNSIATFELINFFSWSIAILTRVISAKKTEAVSFFSKIKFAKSELPTAFLIPWSRYKFSTFSGDCSSLISVEDWISAITSLIKSLMKCQPIMPAVSDYNDQNIFICPLKKIPTRRLVFSFFISRCWIVNRTFKKVINWQSI